MTASTDTSIRLLPNRLGVASLTLGLSELGTPGGLARAAGIPDSTRSRRTLRLLGLRECGHGAAILLGSPRLVWTRVAGDVLDVALLVAALRAPQANRRRGAVALALLTVIGAADVVATRAALGTGVGGRHEG